MTSPHVINPFMFPLTPTLLNFQHRLGPAYLNRGKLIPCLSTQSFISLCYVTLR